MMFSPITDIIDNHIYYSILTRSITDDTVYYEVSIMTYYKTHDAIFSNNNIGMIIQNYTTYTPTRQFNINDDVIMPLYKEMMLLAFRDSYNSFSDDNQKFIGLLETMRQK